VKRILAFGVVVAFLLTTPVEARKPRGVVTTLYAHGAGPLGEAEMSTDTVAAVTGGDVAYRPMDPEEPAGQVPKSVLFFSDPAPINCAGNWFAPTWVGAAAGRVTGTVTFTFHTIGQSGTVNVRLYDDVSQACDAMHQPFAAVDVAVPAGQATVEAVLRKVNVAVESSLMVSVFPASRPMYSRIVYDAAAAPTNLTFTCLPRRGAKSCTPE